MEDQKVLVCMGQSDFEIMSRFELMELEQGACYGYTVLDNSTEQYIKHSNPTNKELKELYEELGA